MHTNHVPVRRLFALLLPLFLFAAILFGSMPAPATSATSASLPPAEGTPAPATTGDVKVLFINVGKADAALVMASGKAYLVDTGEKASVPQLFRALNLFQIETLEGVFLTHTHSDHVGGMEALAANYHVKTLYSAEISMDKKKGGNRIQELAEELSLPHRKLLAGDAVEIAPGLAFQVLGPLVYNDQDDNDNSLVLRLTANGRTLLFTGDMQYAQESTLLQAGANLAADILKVGNHGNPDATSEAFARAVSPDYAIISTDTSADADSANGRVLATLGGAQIHVTQDFACGALITLRAGGSVSVDQAQVPELAASISIRSIDKESQTVTLVNNGGETDIGGFFLFSQKGSEAFVFPQGAILKAGQFITVSAEGGGDYLWMGGDKVWNTKKEDAGILYDRYGNELSRAN